MGGGQVNTVGQRMLDRFSVMALSISLISCVLGTSFAVQSKMARGSCVSNLGKIGQATLMYCDDNDDLFPTTFAFNGQQIMWHNKIEPYLKSGMVNKESKGLDINTGAGKAEEMSLGWADSGGSTWHCPEDHVGGNVSYGANALIGGANTNLGGPWSHVRNEWYVESLTRAQVPHPERVVWAGDTNKLWQDDTQRFTAVFSDWMRDDPRVSGRHGTLQEKADWFRKYLSEDYTFNRDDCDPPGLYNCKGPAFRHDWRGKGTGATGMVFCDGHAAIFRAGELKVENIMPVLPTDMEVALR